MSLVNFAVTFTVSVSVEHNGLHVAEHNAELLCQPFLGRAVG